MSLENRVDKIEAAILVMKDLPVNHNDRLENYFKAVKKSREDFEFKMNALIDAQLKNESGIAELKEASQSQLQRIEKLENK